MKSQHTIASTNASRSMQTLKPKLALELAIFPPEKNFKFFSPTLKEKIKTPDRRKPTTKKQLDNDSKTHGGQGLQQLDRQNASW